MKRKLGPDEFILLCKRVGAHNPNAHTISQKLAKEPK